MTDIVKRSRKQAACVRVGVLIDSIGTADILDEATDEIEQLRTALEKILDWSKPAAPKNEMAKIWDAACSALGEQP